MMLAIRKNTWHYKYYEFLNIFFSNGDAVCHGLCKYAQYIFWLSILLALFSPLLLWGWITLKILRFLYKICFSSNYGKKIFNSIGDLSEKWSNYAELDISVYVLIGFTSIIFMAALTCAITIVIFGISLLLENLLLIPGILLLGISYIGWAFFYIFYVVGLLMSKIKWLAIYLGNFAVDYNQIVFIIIAMLLVIFSFVVLFIMFLQTKWGKSLIDYFSLKRNGFYAAREAAKKRQHDCLSNKVNYVNRSPSKMKLFFGKLKKVLFSTFFKSKSGNTYQVLGLFSLIWITLKSIKEGICPLVEFIDEEKKD